MTTFRPPGPFAVAAVYVGAVVGAGFASGQEVLRFFSTFGTTGTAGLALATGLLTAYGILVLTLGGLTRSSSYRDLLEVVAGGWAPFFDALLAVALFVGLAAMYAGSGALLAEGLGLPRWAGSLALAAASVATALRGLTGVVASLAVLTPALAVMALAVAAGFWWEHPP
ncbi:MAG: hypothetical protein IRY95_08015, partial [Clostridia bacterium]|nr:hypothetical protein [Clostridia bacterium]